jgi:FkbM family methyltransferase
VEWVNRSWTRIGYRLNDPPIVDRVFSWLAPRIPLSVITKLTSPHAGESVLGTITRWATRPLRYIDITIPYGECAGLRFNATGSAPSFALGTSEPAVQAALAGLLTRGRIFYDIGANVGFYTLLGARRVGSQGRVYAFEPVPANIAALNRNIKLSGFTNVTVFPYAVVDRSRPVTFVLSRESFWGRLSTLPPPRSAIGTIPVPGISIDEIVAEGDMAPPDVVKIDVEGAESDVLRGMLQTLRTSRPVIICELHGTWSEVTGLLESANYQVRPLVRETRGQIEQSRQSRHLIATFSEY